MADRNPGAPPADATRDRAAQDHEQADIETGGEPQPGRYPADAIEGREGDVTPGAPNDGGERNEKRGPPTARDAAGNKQRGYATGDKAAGEEDPPLGK